MQTHRVHWLVCKDENMLHFALHTLQIPLEPVELGARDPVFLPHNIAVERHEMRVPVIE